MTLRRFWMFALSVLVLGLADCGDDGPVGPSGPQPGLTDPAIVPQVISTYPADGTTGPFNVAGPGEESRPHFVVELNKLIERGAFRSNWFRIDGFDTPVEFDLDAGFVGGPSDSDQLTRVLPIRIRSALYEVGRTYRVTVDTTLTDFTGRHLKGPKSFSFTPEPWFRVLWMRPNQSSADGQVDNDAILWLQFNSRVDSTIFNSIRISPPVPGAWHQHGPYSVFFQNSREFAFGARYTITVDPTASDTHENRLRSPFESQIRIVRFEIQGTSPANLQTGIYERSGVRVLASADLDVATVPTAFQIQPTVTGRLVARRREIDFGDVNFDLDTRYTVTISTALHAVNGTPLAAPYTFSFTTDQFRVRGSSPRDGEPFAPRDFGCYIYCNARIDTLSIRQAFSISPAAPGMFSAFDSEFFTWKPDVPLPPATVYTVTISRALRSHGGAQLAAPYVFTFRTTPQ